MAAVASSTAATTRRHSTVTSTAHPGSRAARDGAIGHATGAGNRAGPLMSDALTAVPARDEEHGCTVRHSSNDGSGCNTSTSGVDLTACANVASMAPPSPDPPVEVAAGLATAFGPDSGSKPPAGRGQAVLIKLVRSLTVESLLCQKGSAGLWS